MAVPARGVWRSHRDRRSRPVRRPLMAPARGMVVDPAHRQRRKSCPVRLTPAALDSMAAFSRAALSRFLILYGTLYAGYGVQSPYLPSLLDSRNLRPEAIALVLAVGTAVRLAVGPAAGRLADRLDAPKPILAFCSAAAALIALGYLLAQDLWALLAVGVFHSAALGPLAPLSDTLALGTAAPARML